jgi:hypothetical protein
VNSSPTAWCVPSARRFVSDRAVKAVLCRCWREQNKALAVGEPGDIDWAFYQEKLPYLDIDALKANYQQFQSAIPAISYDASADAAAHAEQVRVWYQNASCFLVTSAVCVVTGGCMEGIHAVLH